MRPRTSTNLRRRARGSAHRDRGAVMVEFAAVVTLLCTLAFGVVEFGFAWQDKVTVETAARAGARTGSGVGKDRLADYAILQGVRSAVGDIGIDNVQYVVVYNANTTDGKVPQACTNGTSQNGLCNVYTGAQLSSLTQSSFSGTSSCGGSAPDRFWCPTTRKTVQITGTDYVGVWVKADVPTITKLFGSSTTITSTAVMRLEPAEIGTP